MASYTVILDVLVFNIYGCQTLDREVTGSVPYGKVSLVIFNALSK